MIIESLNDANLKENKLLIINNINEGFNNYKNKVLDYSRLNFEDAFFEYYKILEEKFKVCDDSFIFDFYKENINETSLNIIRNNIEEENYLLIEEMYNLTKEDRHFYKSKDIRLLKSLLRLSLKELYFVTFYFKETTIWSSYNQKFIIFIKK